MRIFVAILICLGLGALACMQKTVKEATDRRTSNRGEFPRCDTDLLPEKFSVYTAGDNMVVNTPGQGLERKILPTINSYTTAPGCYLVCYSRLRGGSIYGVGGGIYVMGQIRVPGRYRGRVCRPAGYEAKDISAEPRFKDLCGGTFRTCRGRCWAGGDTGGWFGIQ